MLELHIAGEKDAVRPSVGHPFWVKRSDSDSGHWIDAGNLHAGELVATLTGDWRKIESITTVDREQPVYNFTVAKDHDYFVGETGFLVHNAGGCGCSPDPELLRYWKWWDRFAPVLSSPFNVIRKYDEGGNITGATTYDEWGYRSSQYEINDAARHGPGFHRYDNEGPIPGCGNGPRSDHFRF